MGSETKVGATMLASVMLAATTAAPVMAQGSWGILPPGASPPPSFAQVIARVEGMPQDAGLRARVSARELAVMNLMWEDTGRFQGSSVGPNISDMTLEVREPQPGGAVRTHLLPVIRYPNFTDRTADVRA